MKSGSNYPPGVTGNEPDITGADPDLAEQLGRLKPGDLIRVTTHAGYNWRPVGSGWSKEMKHGDDIDLGPTTTDPVRVVSLARQTFSPYAEQLTVRKPGTSSRRHWQIIPTADIWAVEYAGVGMRAPR